MTTINVQTAPIQRYSDPRLYGGCLFAPFSASYQWTRTIRNPWHSECNLIAELAIRTIKLVTGIASMAAATPFALAGRVVQMIHYHTLSPLDRSRPTAQMSTTLGQIFSRVVSLPRKDFPPSFYYNNQEDCINLSISDSALINESSYQYEYRRIPPHQILRWGHSMKHFCYFEGNPFPKPYDDFIRVFTDPKDIQDRTKQSSLVLSVDLLEGEVGRTSEENFQYLINSSCRMSRGCCENLALREKIARLFRNHGIRALAVENENQITKWFLFDPASISITGVQ